MLQNKIYADDNSRPHIFLVLYLFRSYEAEGVRGGLLDDNALIHSILLVKLVIIIANSNHLQILHLLDVETLGLKLRYRIVDMPRSINSDVEIYRRVMNKVDA